jgi:hypothetical protein
MSAAPAVTPRVLRDWRDRYSNADRFGAPDGPGTLALVTRERVLAACSLPRRGIVIACAQGEPSPAPTARLAGRPGQLAQPIVGRGVLLDVARHRRRRWLEDGTAILPSELDQCAESQGVALESGDLLLVRTGRLARARAERRFEEFAGGPAPGLSVHCAGWLFERQLALVASDTFAVEVVPPECSGVEAPLRGIALAGTGLVFGESFGLESLAEACGRDRRFAFLLVLAPLPGPDPGRARVLPLAIK